MKVSIDAVKALSRELSRGLNRSLSNECLNRSSALKEWHNTDVLIQGQPNTHCYVDPYDHLDYEPIWSAEKGCYGYINLEGWNSIDPAEMERFEIQLMPFLFQLQLWFDIPNRVGINTLIEKSLFELGEIWVGKKKVSVLFMREGNDPGAFYDVRSRLRNYPKRQSYIVLTDVEPDARIVDLPGDPLIIELSAILDAEKYIKGIDFDGLATLLGVPVKSSEHNSYVSCSNDGRYLRIGDDEYLFSGVTQPRIVRLLFEAWQDGKDKSRTAAILEQVESSARALSHVFKGANPSWKQAISYGNGNCWLNIQ